MINKQFIFNKALPKVLVALLGLVVLSLLGLGAYFLVSKLTNVPYKVRVTNITGSSATVSWYTNRPDNGLVVYGQEKGFWYGFVSFLGKNIGYDDRDWALAEKDLISDIAKAAKSQQSIENTDVEVHKLGNYYVHHVTIRDLDPNTKYYFKVGNGLWSWDLEEERQLTAENQLPTVSTAFEFSTYDHPKDIPTPKPAYGRVYGMVKDSQGYLTEDDSTDSIVFVLENKSDASGHSQILSSVTNEKGGWTVDKSNFRDQNGILAKGYIEGKDLLVTYVQYQNNEENSMQAFLLGKNDAPTPGLRGNSLETLENPKVSMSLFKGSFVGGVFARGYEIVGEDENGYPIIYDAQSGNYTNEGTHDVVNENDSDVNDVITEWTSPAEEEDDTEYEDPPRDDVLMSADDLEGTNLPTSCYSGYKYDATAGGCVPDRPQPTTAGNTACEEVGALGCEIPNCYCEIKNAAGVPIGRYPMSKDCRPASCANSNRRTDEVVNQETGNLEVKSNICPVSVKCSDGSCPAEHGGKCPVPPAPVTTDDLDPGLEQDRPASPVVSEAVTAPALNGNCEGRQGSISGSLQCSCAYMNYGCTWKTYTPPTVAVPTGWKSCGNMFIPSTVECKIPQDLYKQCSGNYYILKTDNCNTVLQNNTPITWGYSLDDPQPTLMMSQDSRRMYCRMDNSEEVFYDYYTGDKPDCPQGFTEAVWGYPIDTDQTFWVASDAREIQCYMPGTNEVYFDYIQNGEEYACPENLFVPAYTVYSRINNDNGLGSVNSSDGLGAWMNETGGVCCNNGSIAFPNYKTESNIDACKGAVSKLDKCNVQGASTKLESFNLVSKVNAASESSGSVIYLPESGVYSSSLNGVDVSFFGQEGQAIFLYEERNGTPGYQSPSDLSAPLVTEDKLITDAATSVKLEKTSSAFNLELKEGVNIISFPYMPTSDGTAPLKASELMALANAGGDVISSITYFDAGKWVGGIQWKSSDNSTNSGLDFDLTFGKGYLIVSKKNHVFEVPGFEVLSGVPVALSSGWNLVGIHGYTETYTASSLIDSIGTIEGLGADNVTYWPTSKGRYEGLQKSEGTEYGFDFPIREDLGYFVRINKFEPKETSTKSIIWNPGGDLNGKPGSN